MGSMIIILLWMGTIPYLLVVLQIHTLVNHGPLELGMVSQVQHVFVATAGSVLANAIPPPCLNAAAQIGQISLGFYSYLCTLFKSL